MARKKIRYSVHPNIAMVQKWIAELPVKTGRSLEQWLKLIEREGPADEKARRDWLKREYGHGTRSATFLAERSCGKGLEDGDPKLYLEAAERYVAEMFADPRARLQPVYERLLELGLGQGKDVKACPCLTIVPLYRQHVFAQIKPATNSRIDLGFALGSMPATGRLIDTGGFAKRDRITHRIPIATLDEIDDEVEAWLQKAYELDG
jgi:hypothetical protein